MKIKALSLLTVFLLGTSVFGQKVTMDLTFTAIEDSAYIQLDSIKVQNRTQGGEYMIYWPDTTLTLEITPGDLLLLIGYSTGYPVGVNMINQVNRQFRLFPNYPNPVKDQSTISLYIPEKGTINIMITDMQGRVVISSDWQLENGNHSFRFYPGGGNFFVLTARWNGISQSIKVMTTELNPRKKCIIDYIGKDKVLTRLKATLLRSGFVMQESGILDAPNTDETYIFQFATNIPCPGTPNVTYEGKVYNTIQIYSQCWLKENLNVGTMILEYQDMTDNGIIEKYCYNNESDSCMKYGGLYQWDETMQYNTQQGTQGICPQGWHIPTDEEFKVLEGAVDSLYGIGDSQWNINGFYRGYDAGKNLKTIVGWISGGNGTDLFGFSGLPGGSSGFGFGGNGHIGSWWSSTNVSTSNAWERYLYYYSHGIFRQHYLKETGLSVRCVRDY